MYDYIDGKLASKTPTAVVIEAGGVGYFVNISLNTYSLIAAAERCKLFTWQHVKEDAHTLYGFAEEGERKLFRHLISVSGIGPNTARTMLSSISPADIRAAIQRGDVPMIQRIKGIGPKSAQRMILELQDKLKKEGPVSPISASPYTSAKDEALTALVMLGFAGNQAEKALIQVSASGENLSAEDLIKAALKNL